MSPKCENISKHILPLLRALVAKELLNTYSLTQVEVAEKLGTTQAAISQYMNSKRAAKGAEEYAYMLPKIQTLATDTAKQIVEKKTKLNDTPLDLCKLCSIIVNEAQNQATEDYVI